MRGVGQRAAEVAEERRQALDVHRAVKLGKRAGEHHAVFQSIAGAGGGLGAIV